MGATPADGPRVSRPRTLLWPVVWTVALLPALLFAPFPLASALPGGGYPDRSALVDSLSSTFVHYWAAGSSPMSPDLAVPVDFWARFHVVKGGLAALLLLVLVPVISRMWTVYTGAATAARRLTAGALVGLAVLLTLAALLILVANIQGAVAPLSSALGLLPIGGPDPALAQTVTQVRHGLVSGEHNPALEALIHDFTVYHAAMVGLGAVVTLGLLATAVILWQRQEPRSNASQPGRRLLATAVVAILSVSAFFGVATVANLSTVADPAPALLNFFGGGR